MDSERRSGLIISAALHFTLLLIAAFGLPSFLRPHVPPQPMVIAVELLPISAVTNVKTSDLPLAKEEKPTPQEEEKKPTPPVKAEEPPPSPPPPPEKKPEVKKEEKKPEPKKPEPKKEEKKKPKKEDDLEAVLKSLRDEKKKTEKSEEQKDKKDQSDAGTKVKGKNTNYDDRLPMSVSELDAIRSQIAKCWNVPAGAKNAENLQVTLRVQLDQTGMVIDVQIADESKSRYASGDTFFRAAADSAVRAVRQCSPLRNLPPEKYQTWRDIEMAFDPKEMLF